MPDGSVCKTELVMENGQVQKNTTTCTKPETQRRLQLLPPPMFGGGGENPMDDLWVLGGVFLERYVTIFDFDGARIGFAEPAASSAALRGRGLAPAVNDFLSKGSSSRDTTTSRAWLSAPTAAFVGAVLAAGAASILYLWRASPFGARRVSLNLVDSIDLPRLEGAE
jgi:hypothetical protein